MALRKIHIESDIYYCKKEADTTIVFRLRRKERWFVLDGDHYTPSEIKLRILANL
jgi:hypothetical protein